MNFLKFYNKYFEVVNSLDSKFKESKNFYLLKILVNIILLITICSSILLLKELIEGNHPTYSKVFDCTVCNDGWISYSGGAGACSWHNGVKLYKYKTIETGVYFANPKPYLYIFIISFSILITFSIFNKKIRALSVKSFLSIISNTILLIIIILSPFIILMKNVYLFILRIPLLLKRGLIKIKSNFRDAHISK